MAALVVTLFAPVTAWPEGEVLEFACRSCGYRERFVQGSSESDQARNVQQVIVVCERTGEIRNIAIPLDPQQPVHGEPLLARQYGTGRSELLGVKLPRFLVPGNTCPLFPITAYLERNICPIDGKPGIEYSVVGYY
jgi:RNase P subunit RPR2